MSVTVWGVNQSPAREATEYLTDVLNKIGWKATPKLLAGDVFFQTVGNQATRAQIVWVNWYQDYPHPLDWFDGPFNGNRITEVHNNNIDNVDYADVNAAIERLKRSRGRTAASNAAWANVDRELVVRHAALAPYVNAEGADFLGTRIDASCYYNHVLYLFDWTAICLKG
jgi:peptide/nickel transport system substrate-binding protein